MIEFKPKDKIVNSKNMNRSQSGKIVRSVNSDRICQDFVGCIVQASEARKLHVMCGPLAGYVLGGEYEVELRDYVLTEK